MEKKLTILQLTPFYHPNVGGVETHLLDLVKVLTKKYKIKVLTYQSLVGNEPGLKNEKSNNLEIIRIPWFKNLYYKTVKNPLLHFIYLAPKLFFTAYSYLKSSKSNVDIIHAHGINAAFAGALLKKVFGTPLIVSMHVEFNFSKSSLVTKFLLWPLFFANKILVLTKASKDELIKFGVSENKITEYSYWVDQNIFKPLNKVSSRKELKLEQDKFTALFVGRLAKEKGLEIVLSAAEKLKDVIFIIAGTGELSEAVEEKSKVIKNIVYAGKIDNKSLPKYYSAADVLLVPSLVKNPKPTFEEGVPRVIIESLSCGTPVIGTDNGGIKEVLTKGGVGIVCESTGKAFVENINKVRKNAKLLSDFKSNAVKFVNSRFNVSAVENITKTYEEINTINKVNPFLTSTGDMALKRRTKWIFENLDLRDSDKVLDVGCGDGFYLHLLSSINPKLKLEGTDFDERALESAKRNLKGRKINLSTGDLMKALPFKSQTFDKVIMSEVTEHLPDDVKGLKEVNRVLKPGGVALITVPHANYPFMWDPLNWMLEHLFDTHIKSGFFAGIWNQHERLYEKNQIKKVIEKAGFSVVEQKYITWWCLPFSHYIINTGARILVKAGSTGFAEGTSKFLPSQKRSFLPKLYFGFAGLADKLNDFLPVSSGVSVVTLATKS